MTNFEKWRFYMDWCVAPDNYIDWGFYYLISASLQRRVWSGPEHMPLYPNMFGILTGEPGVGKGIVIKQVAKFLKHHIWTPPQQQKPLINPVTPLSNIQKAELIMQETVSKAEYDSAIKEEESIAKNKGIGLTEKPLSLPVAADATTYEALVNAMAKSLRRKNYKEWLEIEKREKLGIYLHSSLCFCLEEISSLFRHKMEDLVNFLLVAYDCGDYNYETIRRGKDRIRSCCLNFFGGTTPGFMRSVFNDQLLSEGFSSRTFFIFAIKNRKTQMQIPPLTPEQMVCRDDLLAHIGKLIDLYGHVSYTKEAWEFLEEWWKKAQEERPNTNIKLNPYYARKNLHVQKLAMALHFGESTEMVMDTPVFLRALKILAEEEKKMHYCLGLDNRNPLAEVLYKIEQYIVRGGKYTFKELLTEFWSSFPHDPQKACLEVLEHLEFTNKIIRETGEHPVTKESVVYYKALQQSAI